MQLELEAIFLSLFSQFFSLNGPLLMVEPKCLQLHDAGHNPAVGGESLSSTLLMPEP